MCFGSLLVVVLCCPSGTFRRVVSHLPLILRARESHPGLHYRRMNSDSEGEQPRIDISFANPSVPSNFDFAIVDEGAEATPSSPVQNSQFIEISSSPDSVHQRGSGLPSASAGVDCERSRSRGQLRDLCRAGLRATMDQNEANALVPMGEPDADADGAVSNTFNSLASSLRSVAAAMEDQKNSRTSGIAAHRSEG